MKKRSGFVLDLVVAGVITGIVGIYQFMKDEHDFEERFNELYEKKKLEEAEKGE